MISLASVPIILDKGAEYYRDFGMGRSRGTLPFQLAGNIKHAGLVEKAFGLTLRELLYDYGGGSATGRPIRAVQVGGPLGAYLPESQFDTPLDYEAFAAIWAVLGHGGIVVFDDTVDMAQMARYAMEFCAIESCGKCTPCRIGSTRGVEVIDKIIARRNRDANIALLRDLCDTMLNGSLCALGGMTPYPVLSALNHFPEDFARPAPRQSCLTTGIAECNRRHPCSQNPIGFRHPASAIDVIRLRWRSTVVDVTVPAGTSVMQAAMTMGIKIPKLCATDSSSRSVPAGCAWCEIEGGAVIPLRARPRSRTA